jgi:hypothetical protein
MATSSVIRDALLWRRNAEKQLKMREIRGSSLSADG